MNPRCPTSAAFRSAALLLAAGLLGNGVAAPLRAAAAPAPAGATAPAAAVELPPLMVEESTAAVPWLYVNAGGTEFLSRCSAGTTSELVGAWLAKMQLARFLVPPEFLAQMDVPEVFVLYGQDVRQTMSAEIQRELQAAAQAGTAGVNVAPSMRLGDRDMHASIAYVDEALFDASTMSVSPNHLRYLLARRVPELPPWLIEGVERTYRRADVLQAPVTFVPFVWFSEDESDAVRREPTYPRALVPATELFAPPAQRTVANRHPRHLAARAATQELFVRWALLTSPATRQALWQFAARAAAGPTTEADFTACFGFGFAELRDRLSDYLPRAVTEQKRLYPTGLPPLPPIEVERATPNQIARIRGEWERLAIGHVQRRFPQAREPYLVQARRTLRRAYDAGDRDPRLLATLGLLEVDAGNDAGARPFLEPAVARGVVRPRAHFELARLAFADLRQGAAPDRRFSFAELAPVFQPLRQALAQSPALPENYTLLGQAWARSEAAPTDTEWAELATGARLFARQPDVARSLALAYTHHGRRPAALALLDTCLDYAADDTTRTELRTLRTTLATLAP